MTNWYGNGAHMMAYPISDMYTSWAYVSPVVIMDFVDLSTASLFVKEKQGSHGVLSINVK